MTVTRKVGRRSTDRPSSSLWHDEQGKKSAGRAFLAVGVVLTVITVLAEVFLWRQPANAVYTLEGTWLMAGVGWVAGPRIAQYLFPQMGSAASAISAATRAIATRRAQGKSVDAEPTP